MAQEIINNGESGLIVRTKLNNMFGEVYANIVNISGITDNKLFTTTFDSFTGTTLPNNYYNKDQVNIIVSGATSGLTSSWNEITNKPSWLSGNTLNDFESGHNHSQYNLVTDFNTFTGTTLPNNYYNKTQINNYTGNTIPNTYALKTRAITGGTNIGTGTPIFSGVTNNKINAKSLKVSGTGLSISGNSDSITINGLFNSIFDCTIGIGGNYLTFNDAYTAGKRSMKVIGNTSLSANITIDNCYLYLDDFTFACGVYNFTINSGKLLIIEGIGSLTFGYASEKVLFVGNTYVRGFGNNVKNLTITNNSTIANCRINDTGKFNNLIVYLGNYNAQGFGKTGSEFLGSLIDLFVYSAGSNCDICLGQLYTQVTNMTITGAFGTISGINISKLYANSTGMVNCATSEGVYGTSLTLRGIKNSDFVVGYILSDVAEYQYTNGYVTNAHTIGSNTVLFSNIRFASTLTNANDYCKIIGCVVNGLLTLSSGSEYNVIIGNTLTGGFINSSGNLTNEISNNI